VAQHRPARVAVAEPGRTRDPGSVRQTRLAWRVAERLRGGCLVEVDLETGFLHQVRVSLAHLGAPLAGDRVYGPAPEADPSGAARHMLHAASVQWEGIRAESPDPPDFAAVLARLRG
jgi:23S rRNA-/tRNA-specific pseudouridylate synthase